MSELFNKLFIFEMANNHQGSVAHGMKIIHAVAEFARKHKINAGVKFQYRDLDSFIHPDFRDRKDVAHIPRFLETRLSDAQFLELVKATRDAGLVTICTPFDEVSVQKIVEHEIAIIKIASCSANDWPLLEEAAKTGKPMIVSTAGKGIYEIDNVVSFLTHRNVDFALMHCVAIYPTPADQLQLDFLDRLMRRYPYVPVGYSGHEAPDDLDTVKIAVAKGAAILERHIGVPTETVKLNAYSMNPAQADLWVASALQARRMSAPSSEAVEKEITPAESQSLNSLARGVYAKNKIAKGQTISRDNVFFAMPCVEGQTTSGEFQDTMVASRDYSPREAIYERRQPSLINQIRGIVHDAKGMLYEAGIDFGKEFTIELSHHYGMEHFRKVGALIVNVINREYCKKLVVVLPGQWHPVHMHKLKEETFHMLWGQLDVNLEGQDLTLKRGDKLLIERGAKHSFTSSKGAIFEEVSTTHIVGDSYYDEDRIKRLDPIQRKTILEEW